MYDRLFWLNQSRKVDAYYFIGDQLMGIGKASSPSAHSQVFVCNSCGEVWGRIQVEDTERTWAKTTLCPDCDQPKNRCAAIGTKPSCLLSQKDSLKFLPPTEILEHDFLWLMDNHEENDRQLYIETTDNNER